MRIRDRIRAAASRPELVTVPDVPIISTGIEYPLASGPTTFTQQDLADVVASQDDPAIHSPRIKIGHTDPRFNSVVDLNTGLLKDGEPALGTVQNMRLSADQQTVFGDLVGLPRWLAEIMSSAYPARSVEGAFNVETVTGHSWSLVLDGLALLGVMGPGVTTLDDIQALYSPEGPEGVVVLEAEQGEQMGTQVAAHRGSGVAASINVEDVRRAYYDQLDAVQMWWWIRAVYLDPNELIVDDDEGDLYRVPFTVSGEAVTFSDPEKVKIEYVAASHTTTGEETRQPVALVASAGRQLAIYANRAAAGARSKDNTEEVSSMTAAEIRQNLGLPSDATDEQVSARITELRAAEAQPAPEPGDTPDPPAAPAATPSGSQTPEGEEPEETPEGEEPAGEGEERAAASATVSVPRAVWEQVQANAQSGAAVAEQNRIERRDRVVEDAIKAGKIAPAARESMRKQYDLDPTTTDQLLTATVSEGGLAPDVIPVTARGVAPSDDAVNASEYPPEWLPEVQQSHNNNRVTQEV